MPTNQISKPNGCSTGPAGEPLRTPDEIDAAEAEALPAFLSGDDDEGEGGDGEVPDTLAAE